MASPNLYDVNHSGFFMFCKEIMSRIVDETGFTLVFANNLPTDFTTIALACPVVKFLSLTNFSQVSTSQFVLNTAAQTVINVSERIIFQDDAEASTWVVANNEWELGIVQDAEYTFEITGTVEQAVDGIRQDSEIRIVRNLSTVATFFLSGDLPAGTAFFLSATITAHAGYVIFGEIESFVIQATATIETNTKFKISTSGADVDRLVQVSESMPRIERKTFFTSILNIFNLVLITDDVAKTVTIKNFNDIFSATEQDLTSRLDVGGTVEIRPGIARIGQNSKFTW